MTPEPWALSSSSVASSASDIIQAFPAASESCLAVRDIFLIYGTPTYKYVTRQCALVFDNGHFSCRKDTQYRNKIRSIVKRKPTECRVTRSTSLLAVPSPTSFIASRRAQT